MASVVLCRSEEERALFEPYLTGVRPVTNAESYSKVLVRWGNRSERAKADLTLNDLPALQRAASRRSVMALLHLNRIRCLRLVSSHRDEGRTWVSQDALDERGHENYMVQTIRWQTRYIVHVVNLRVIAIYQERRGRRPVRIADRHSKLVAKIIEMAVHSLHLLGLDFGRVDVALDSDDSPLVMDVDPAPKLTNRLAHLYGEALSRYVAELSSYIDAGEAPSIRMGADPEFMLRHRETGKMIMASRFFPNGGPVGCDARTVYLNGKHHPLAELRPEPDSSPRRLVDNIRRTMALALKLAPFRNVEWVAGSQPYRGYPVGGHIHFSGVRLNSVMLRALDNYLGIPVMLMEYPKTAKARRRRYGRLGDHRYKEHGGFEYRTLASWLVSPAVTRGILALASLVSRYFIVLRENNLDTYKDQRAFYQNDKPYFRDWFTQMWRRIMMLPGYEEVSDDLAVVYDLITSHRVWSESEDIRRTWKLSIPTAKFRYASSD
ncbi:MAG: putative amidoligase domain-containing protein [Bacillota bacterium]